MHTSLKKLRWYDVIVLMDVELIHKLDMDNLVLDTLSRKEEFMGVKLHDTMMLSTIIYCDESSLIKGVKEAYKVDDDALKINRIFAMNKSIKKQKRLTKVS